MTQLKLDFCGKKTERITFAATEDLKIILDKLQMRLNRNNISELVQEYVIGCAIRDLGKLLLLKNKDDKRLVDLL